jgi:exo-beta-1,3-glucanase (GH17 family)
MMISVKRAIGPVGEQPGIGPKARVRRGLGLVVLGLWAGGMSAASTSAPHCPRGESCPRHPESAVTSVVSTSGWHVLSNGERFIIKGVCYNPVPAGSTTRSWDTLDEDILLMQDAGINTIRVYSPIAETWVLDHLAAAGIKVIMGFTAHTGAYSISSGGYLTYVESFRNHDAILLWELGNEYNYHPEWFGGDVGNWYAMLEDAARRIHLIDPDHPVSTAHGEVPSASTLALAPSVDVWGMNVYRWDYSQHAITDFAAVSDKPCYLSETGGDSYNSAPSHPTYPFGANEQMQADATQALLTGVFDVLDVGSGVALFEFSDEWWKAGDPANQDAGGAAPYSSGVPYDGAPNEEYWGVVDVFRTAKLAHGVVGAVYTGPTCLVSAHAGPDRFLPVGATWTTLDGSASSPSGDLTFEWSQSSGPAPATLPDPASSQPTISDLTPGVYTFSLTVTGGCGSSTDAVAVSVAETANLEPIANAGPDRILATGTSSATLDGSSSLDPDGGPAPLSFTWTQTAGPLLAISGTTEVSPMVAGMVHGESYTFELMVFDGLDPSDPSTVSLVSDSIFADGFETGDLSSWSGTSSVKREAS